MSQEPTPSAKSIIAEYLRLLRQPVAAPNVAAPALSTLLPARDGARPCALLLSPHPDDECITGVLPLRLLREENWQIINVAVTLGSNEARRAERKDELAKACAFLGFDCVLSDEDGLSNINADARCDDPAAWSQKAAKLGALISHYRPEAVFMPHEADWNATHIGTHLLGIDALATMPPNFSCAVVQAEYWQPMSVPNTMIGVSEADVATLLSALTCHKGEVARNPYDRRFPAHLIDNVRRGGERLSGKGATAAPMDFAEMVQLGLWLKGKFVPSALNRFVGGNQSVGILFE